MIVHTWLYHANLIGGILAKLAGIKNIYWSIHHDYEYSSFLMMIEMKILSILSHIIPNKIIYCSFISEINHINNGYKKNCSIIIKNGVSTNKFKPNRIYRDQIRSKLKISDDCLLIGNISRYHPIKDHDNLLKAIYKFNKYNIELKVILIGEGLSKKFRSYKKN